MNKYIIRWRWKRVLIGLAIIVALTARTPFYLVMSLIAAALWMALVSLEAYLVFSWFPKGNPWTGGPGSSE